MGHDREINKVNIIQNALNSYEGFTSGEKKYCKEHLSEWVSEDSSLNLLINKFEEKYSIDAKPFLAKTGLLA